MQEQSAKSNNTVKTRKSGIDKKRLKNLVPGILFLSPNILGFLAFTLIPLVFSMVLAFTNWDLTQHNMFHPDEPIKFVGFENFRHLLQHGDFYKYLGNTLFFMIGIPFGIAGSLILALMLSKDMRGGSRRIFGGLIAGAVLAGSVLMLLVVGAEQTALVVLLCGLVSFILLMGVLGGSTIYRTLCYLPSFTSGVAVFILWKKLYNPYSGPVNVFLRGPLDSLTGVVRGFPAIEYGMWVCLALVLFLAYFGLSKLRKMWHDGDLGWSAGIVPIFFLVLPLVMWFFWAPGHASRYIVFAIGAAIVIWQATLATRGQDFPCSREIGLGGALMLGMAIMVGEFVLLGFALVCNGLPAWAGTAEGLTPPEWLSNYYWAKPAIMIMGLWGAIGSNNMLLYLAGLSNVPQDLYEAADIDGASRFQKFWQVTWPQLAPTTFFIVVMSVIGGLQGGFEMARTMTQGGPAGATTTMSYFIYSEGFETGRLGYSSAAAWILFALVFSVTMFNWRFGNRYVND